MVDRTLSIVLALTIVACPLVCRSRLAIAGATQAQESGCCNCCHSTRGPAQQGGPTCPSQPTPPSSGSCLCGGAVVDHATMPDVSPIAGWSTPVAIIDALLTVQIVAAHWDNFSTPPPGSAGGMNAGRALCYFYGTILC